MTYYKSFVYFKDNGDILETIICKLTNEKEKKLYENERFKDLLKDTQYKDEDIFLYLMPDEDIVNYTTTDFVIWSLYEIKNMHSFKDIKELLLTLYNTAKKIEDLTGIGFDYENDEWFCKYLNEIDCDINMIKSIDSIVSDVGFYLNKKIMGVKI